MEAVRMATVLKECLLGAAGAFVPMLTAGLPFRLAAMPVLISARGIFAQGLSFDEASVRELETRCDAERQNVRQCKDVVGRLAQETAGEPAPLPHAPLDHICIS